MRSTSTFAGVALTVCARLAGAASDPPPIAEFARGPMVIDAAISPDGRYLAVLTSVGDSRALATQDRTAAGSRLQAIMRGDPKTGLDLDWCGFVSPGRLICGIGGTGKMQNGTVYALSRLVALDVDGKHMRELVQDSGAAAFASQFQDRIVDWTPGKADAVLIAAEANTLDFRARAGVAHGGGTAGQTEAEFPSVFALDTATGEMSVRYPARAPLRGFFSDHSGNVRLGWGLADNSDVYEYAVHDASGWRTLLTHKAGEPGVLTPIALCVDSADCAYALGTSEGRKALWRMDLTGKSPPKVEFSHPAVDVQSAVFASDGRLVGVRYDTDRPFVYYVDPKREAVARAVQSAVPGAFIVIRSVTRDDSLYLVRASSDIDYGTYLLYDARAGTLTRIATGYPELAKRPLGRMQSTSYPASDGKIIPGYLTTPPGVRAEHLPLIVMPHGGPQARDTWAFDYLREFLASRGYAVLQMEFRGSSGYGEDWLYAAHQDWGGLTYSDIVDGARWAVKEGIADPRRMCILGWSFGGYAAELGAVRNPDLFHCAASIAGISDLALLERESRQFVAAAIVRKQIGTDPEKLRADSPLRHIGEISVPVLLMHGDRDANVPVDQSRALDAALSAGHKPHQYIEISGATHQMQRESDRVTLLTALEKFFTEQIGPGVRATD